MPPAAAAICAAGGKVPSHKRRAPLPRDPANEEQCNQSSDGQKRQCARQQHPADWNRLAQRSVLGDLVGIFSQQIQQHRCRALVCLAPLLQIGLYAPALRRQRALQSRRGCISRQGAQGAPEHEPAGDRNGSQQQARPASTTVVENPDWPSNAAAPTVTISNSRHRAAAPRDHSTACRRRRAWAR